MGEEQDMFNQSMAARMGMQAYSAQASNELNTLLSELSNPEQDIYEVELSLKGMQLDSKGNAVRVTDALLNDKGVSNMLRLMRSMVSRVMFMSNLEEDQIRILTIELGEHIVSDLVMHKAEYSIKDFETMTTIRTIVTYKAFEAGMSALENGFRRFLKSGIVETTISTQGQMPTKSKGGGVMSLLGIGRK